jgi:release factor glutamine methyltransferase
MPTIHERVASAREILKGAGISQTEAELSARILAQHALGWAPTRYFTSGDQLEPPEFAERYGALVARRAAREPAAYITGLREFWGLPFEVTPDVLIPRPETELIVEAALDLLGPDRRQSVAVADACTGCGCVAVALARELPHSSIVATDISERALQVARRNAERHDVRDRIHFACTDVLHDIAGTFDVIVGNPPYVRAGDGPALQPEVRDHEPSVALFGGDNGVDVMTDLVAQATARLRQGGYLIFEFGFGQEIDAEDLIGKTPELTFVGLRRDLQGLARTAVARRI